MPTPTDLFANNRRWAAEHVQRDPDFFARLARQQKPAYLWIGCSDSRVPANEIVGLLPGEMFVHRNVANVVVHSDLNCLSVVQFAIDVLGVRHVIVCGHYGCGGIAAAAEPSAHGLVDNWLGHVRDVAQAHAPRLAAITDDARRLDRLCELNVIEQVATLSETTTVRDAWEHGCDLTLHGWIYGLQDGLLRDLGMDARSPAEVAARLAAAAK
ncbi:MAG TPA: carbonate dehydratase [Candidatus Binatia bacterium]|jgi:carbonic anhydrase